MSIEEGPRHLSANTEHLSSEGWGTAYVLAFPSASGWKGMLVGDDGEKVVACAASYHGVKRIVDDKFTGITIVKVKASWVGASATSDDRRGEVGHA